MKNRIEEVINSQIDNLKNLKESDYSNKLIEISNLITKSIEKGGKILIAVMEGLLPMHNILLLNW